MIEQCKQILFPAASGRCANCEQTLTKKYMCVMYQKVWLWSEWHLSASR